VLSPNIPCHRESLMPNMLRIKEHDSEDGKPGRILELSDVEFTPLGFSDLKDAKLSKPMTIPLQGHGTIVVKIGDELPAQSGHFHTYLESHFTSKAIGLAAKPSEQPRTESCVASGNGRCEA
jgi:hypothetical protein